MILRACTLPRRSWQTPSISLLGFLTGAAYAWSLETNRELDIPTALSLFGFEDPTGAAGKLAYDLGNVYLSTDALYPNSSALWHVMKRPLTWIQKEEKLQPTGFQAARESIESALSYLEEAKILRPDAALIHREFTNTARLLLHACQRAALAGSVITQENKDQLAADLNEIIEEYQHLWLARSRQGGLRDSLSHFDTARADYL